MSAAGFADHIRDLSIVLSTAAVTSLISQRLKQPPVLGYLLAGILLGPHVPGSCSAARRARSSPTACPSSASSC
nr:cation:proton antiporter [Nannocystis pusilla]